MLAYRHVLLVGRFLLIEPTHIILIKYAIIHQGFVLDDLDDFIPLKSLPERLLLPIIHFIWVPLTII